MRPAHGHVAFIAADLDLFAFFEAFAVGTDAQVHRGLAATLTDGFELDQVVCEAEEGGASGEKLRLEIGAQAVTQHGHSQLIGDATELFDLFAREKLRFVDKDTGDLFFDMLRGDVLEQVVCIAERIGIGFQADARSDATDAGALIDHRCIQQGAHAPLLVVVTRLKQYGAFTGIHGGVVKVDFRHGERS